MSMSSLDLILRGFGSSISIFGFGAGFLFFLTPFHSLERQSRFGQQSGKRAAIEYQGLSLSPGYPQASQRKDFASNCILASIMLALSFLAYEC
jgi:hypothetical protein